MGFASVSHRNSGVSIEVTKIKIAEEEYFKCYLIIQIVVIINRDGPG